MIMGYVKIFLCPGGQKFTQGEENNICRLPGRAVDNTEL